MRNNRANTRKLISNNSQFAFNLFFLKENQMLQIHVTFGVSRLKKLSMIYITVKDDVCFSEIKQNYLYATFTEL